MDVAVRELKQNLSRYLERAARGEIIRVTDGGRPKAVLGPPQDHLRLADGIAEGWIEPATAKTVKPIRRARSRRRIADTLAEDRDS